MKIKCTTDRKPFAGGAPLALNEIADVPDDEAKALIDMGFAKKATVKDASKD